MKSDSSAMALSASPIENGLAANSHQYVNQTPLLFDSNHDIKSPQKKLEAASANTLNGASLIVPVNMKLTPPPTITVTSTEDSKKNLDGMLDRISHDLDYLLNRFDTDNYIPPPPISSVPIALHSHPSRSVHQVIIEEEPEET